MNANEYVYLLQKYETQGKTELEALVNGENTNYEKNLANYPAELGNPAPASIWITGLGASFGFFSSVSEFVRFLVLMDKQDSRPWKVVYSLGGAQPRVFFVFFSHLVCVFSIQPTLALGKLWLAFISFRAGRSDDEWLGWVKYGLVVRVSYWVFVCAWNAGASLSLGLLRTPVELN